MTDARIAGEEVSEANNKRDRENDLGDESQQETKKPATGSDESIQIKIQFSKVTKVVDRRLDSTVAELKAEIEEQTGVPAANQKLLFKGQLKDESKLRETGLRNGSKLMVIGTKPEDTKVATNVKAAKTTADWEEKPKIEPWSKQPKHQKVLEKGVPDDAWPGIEGRQVPLRDDQAFIPGLLNSHGVKVRLTFRQEIQQVWIGSATHTQKISYGSIAAIEAQPIEGNEKYSILRIQLGASASNSYWLYYVPSQYVAAIKVRILGVASLLE